MHLLSVGDICLCTCYLWEIFVYALVICGRYLFMHLLSVGDICLCTCYLWEIFVYALAICGRYLFMHLLYVGDICGFVVITKVSIG